MKKTNSRILFYDIETAPLQAWIWRPGQQYVGHSQLVATNNSYGIICVTYCWNDGKPAKSIDWGYTEQDTKRVIEEFDKIVATADHIIGKNNKRFDDKMVNAARLLEGLPPVPYWLRLSDDLEVQMRRQFKLPSQSLDYISMKLGLGGKLKMEFQDWVDIVDRTPNGEKALKKMIKYGKKDVEDTRAIWNKVLDYIEPKFNAALKDNIYDGCKHCSSNHLVKNGTRVLDGHKYQIYKCGNCGHWAGRKHISPITQKEGKLI